MAKELKCFVVVAIQKRLLTPADYFVILLGWRGETARTKKDQQTDQERAHRCRRGARCRFGIGRAWSFGPDDKFPYVSALKTMPLLGGYIKHQTQKRPTPMIQAIHI